MIFDCLSDRLEIIHKIAHSCLRGGFLLLLSNSGHVEEEEDSEEIENDVAEQI